MRFLLAILLQSIAMNTIAQLQPISSGVYHWNELPVKKDKFREGRKIVEGTTAEFSFFEIHASTQLPGAPPRLPHAQDSTEELIIVKEGQLTCTIGDKKTTLGPGSVLLIPPKEMQAFENNGDKPLTYYVFMFRSKKGLNMERSKMAGGPLLIHHDSLVYKEANNKGTRKYFERPTATCENYEMHITYLKVKGPSHAPHQHVDTEIILMIDGETEMTIDGKHYTAGPGDLYIAESGKMHGISNATDKPCSYFAFKWR
ncbi:MAG: cupin domain-containing protein [Bacteroidota bacterium]